MNICFGVDYYPEHWPRERWQTDIKLMKEAGFNLVRLAEFSWSRLEPEAGRFDFGWLETVVSLLEDAGIRVILGTPTAAPPAWLIEQDPSILPIDSEGRQVSFGGRHHACQSNTSLRNAARHYLDHFIGKFGSHPNVIGWQIDNELGNSHHDLCHCTSCQRAFQDWLKQKYKTIHELNRQWGTVFWSQDCNHFGQIPTPKWRVAGYNPSQLLDWRRFHSDLILDFHREQAEQIRERSSDRFITHNMMGFADTVNYYKLAEQLDFSSHDQYPGGFFRPDRHDIPALMAAELDMIRGTKQAPFWIMEQQSGITGWHVMGRAPKPGQLALWSMQSVAHGADTVVYFRWRTGTAGTEQYWHGILPHSGIPGRSYRELQNLTKHTKGLMTEIQASMPRPAVAMVFSYDQKYAIDIQPNNVRLDYQEHFQHSYNAFYRRNIPLDVIGDHADLSKYKVVIAPLQYLMSDELAAKYEKYVSGGGKLVLDMRAGVKRPNNLVDDRGPLPGALSSLLGITIPEYDPLEASSVAVEWDEVNGQGHLWADIISLNSAKALAYYRSDFYRNTAAITTNEFGEGEALYLGTEPDNKLLDKLVDYLGGCDELGIPGIVNPESSKMKENGLEFVIRENDKKRYLFVLNHTDKVQTVPLSKDWKAYFLDSKREIGAFGYDVYVNEK